MSESGDGQQAAQFSPRENAVRTVSGLVSLTVVALFLWYVAQEAGIGGGPPALKDAQRGNVQGECQAAVLRMFQAPDKARIPFDPAPQWEQDRWVWRSTVTALTPSGGMAETPFTCTVTGPDANTLTADVVVPF